MSRALAIEMSGRTGSIAVVVDGRAVEQADFAHGLQHAAQVLPIIDRLCRAQQWSPRDIQELYISIGPGSFTGLRIAVTLAKVMSFSTSARVVAVPSTHVLAYNAPTDAQRVAIILDAKRGQIFTASYQRQASEWVEVVEPRMSDIRSVLESSTTRLHLLGEGIPFHQLEIDSMKTSDVILTDSTAWRARAEVLAHLGCEKASRNEFANVDTLTPLYLRLPEAEEKRLAGEAIIQSK